MIREVLLWDDGEFFTAQIVQHCEEDTTEEVGVQVWRHRLVDPYDGRIVSLELGRDPADTPGRFGIAGVRNPAPPFICCLPPCEGHDVAPAVVVPNLQRSMRPLYEWHRGFWKAHVLRISIK